MVKWRLRHIQTLVTRLAVITSLFYSSLSLAAAQTIDPKAANQSQPLSAHLAEAVGNKISRSPHVVVRLGHRRVYVYQGADLQASYPIAIGRAGWETPIGTYQVLNKEKFPIFKSFKTGAIIHPGPNNPLGVRWIGIWTDGRTQLGFHGTNEENLIGQAVSHGCIRMRNQDVIALYDQVSVGTLVTVLP